MQLYRVERTGNTYDLKEMKKGTSELYGGDSYVVLYKYNVNGRDQYIVYYWQVRAQRYPGRCVVRCLLSSCSDVLRAFSADLDM